MQDRHANVKSKDEIICLKIKGKKESHVQKIDMIKYISFFLFLKKPFSFDLFNIKSEINVVYYHLLYLVDLVNSDFYFTLIICIF